MLAVSWGKLTIRPRRRDWIPPACLPRGTVDRRGSASSHGWLADVDDSVASGFGCYRSKRLVCRLSDQRGPERYWKPRLVIRFH